MSARVKSRASTHSDRSGDPLDGLVNMFDLGVVLAVAFLLAALAAFRLTGVLNGKQYAVVSQPGSTEQTIVVKRGDHLEVTNLTGKQVVGQGTRLGTVYRLKDGRLVYVNDASAPSTTNPKPGG
jgi:hypothetical protein